MKRNALITKIIILGYLCSSIIASTLHGSMKKDIYGALKNIYQRLKNTSIKEYAGRLGGWAKNNKWKTIGAVGTLLGVAALTTEHILRKEKSIVSTINKKISQIEFFIKDLDKNFEILKNDVENKENLNTLNKEKKDSEETINKLKKTINDLNETTKQLRDELEALRREHTKEVDTLKQQINVLTEQNKNQDIQIQHLTQTNEQKDAKIQEQVLQIQELTKKNREIQFLNVTKRFSQKTATEQFNDITHKGIDQQKILDLENLPQRVSNEETTIQKNKQ